MYLNHTLVSGFPLTLRYGEERDRDYLADIFAEVWAEIPENDRSAILSRGYGRIVVDVLGRQDLAGVSNTGGDFRLKRRIVDTFRAKPWCTSWPTGWPRRWMTSFTPIWLPGRMSRAEPPDGELSRFFNGGATRPRPTRRYTPQPTRRAFEPSSETSLPDKDLVRDSLPICRMDLRVRLLKPDGLGGPSYGSCFARSPKEHSTALRPGYVNLSTGH